MRKFSEPTCRNLLRPPLLFGLPLSSLLVLIGFSSVGQLISVGNAKRGAIALSSSVLLLLILKVLARYNKPGSQQGTLFLFERIIAPRNPQVGKLRALPAGFDVLPPDTLDEHDLIQAKSLPEDFLGQIEPNDSISFRCLVDGSGAKLEELKVQNPHQKIRWRKDLKEALQLFGKIHIKHAYSLVVIPVAIDPLWLFSQVKDFEVPFEIIVRYEGLNQAQIKQKIEASRRIHSHKGLLQEIDSEITFDEATNVLKGLSRGNDGVIEVSLAIFCETPLNLNSQYFLKEKEPALTLLSSLALRSNFHRSHTVRLSTASDLLPNILDPKEPGTPILRTLRNKPLYFDPMDSRLDALHWLVAGASGTGKSFFTGNILWRMIRDGRALSVLFLDHKRSFKRLVTKCNSPWIEPINCFDLKRDIAKAFQSIDFQGGFAGIELSELPAKERANGLKLIFAELTRFLSQRKSEHAVYIVIDEAWKQLKDDPEAIEQAFREFRKLEAGVIAITQSLADFSAHSIGQSVIQNAETLILLRQQEDVTKFQGFLNLNETETRLVRSITKSKGVFSEVLIKTPHQSRFGRLYPTEEEHETLRTDNLRAKLLNFNLDHKSKKLMPSMGDAE